MSRNQQFSYGGQAVIEGVMMRGANKAAIAARDPNGAIHVKEVPLNAALYKGKVSKTPFLRGLVGLWDAIGLGTRALLWSADVALIEGTYYRVDYDGQVGWILHVPALMKVQGDLKDVPTLKAEDDDAQPEHEHVRLNLDSDKPVKIFASPEPDADVLGETQSDTFTVTGFKPAEKQADMFSGAAGTGMIIVSLALGIGLFILLPTVVSSGLGSLIGLNSTGTTVTEEVIKVSLFLAYITLIGQLEDVKRLFRYHGAEHKTINAYEAGAELTPETVQMYPIEHPRCGTAFLLNVILISVIVNSIIGRFENNILILVPVRLMTVPIVAGIAYEWLRWTAKHTSNRIVQILIKPNLALQRLTTNTPDLSMIEVAIVALQHVLASEGIEAEQPAVEVGTPVPAEA